ncbi:M48 family metallopeptidase [Rhodoferax ferrireducens]|uniref:M48 family metallopeptidase n=1 Tax=Rhodoferax ferrireducens TaxID=192843 RepID=UPI000E0D4F48|nr:SprT family zinc-dependent metalloprotease [Rhodoferax ferrireducens]
MHPLLQFTLDLFGSNQPTAPVDSAQVAIEIVASKPRSAGRPLAEINALASFCHPRANRETRLGDALVAFEFKRGGKRRTIGFSVGPEGLVVSAPKWVPLHEVDAALQEKSLWIIRKLGETAERHERLVAQQIEWCDGTTIPFLGAPVQVLLHSTPLVRGAAKAVLHSAADTAGQTLRLALPQAAAPEQIRDAVQVWLMQQARRNFIERLDHFAPQLQVQWRQLALSNARTRWGSARTDGSIRLNWRLIHFRQPVIDYVVAHELSHLRVMDHSPRFWDTVRSVVPDYAALRSQLKDEATPRWA